MLPTVRNLKLTLGTSAGLAFEALDRHDARSCHGLRRLLRLLSRYFIDKVVVILDNVDAVATVAFAQVLAAFRTTGVPYVVSLCNCLVRRFLVDS